MFKFGASWLRPYGPRGAISGLDNHPVVHVAWAGKELSTEAGWEFAARGGLDAAEYAWGEVFMPGGEPMANTWQGTFPHLNSKEDRYASTSPVSAFPPNGYGLFDMIGNVREWTADWYTSKHDADAQSGAVSARHKGTDILPCRDEFELVRQHRHGDCIHNIV